MVQNSQKVKNKYSIGWVSHPGSLTCKQTLYHLSQLAASKPPPKAAMLNLLTLKHRIYNTSHAY